LPRHAALALRAEIIDLLRSYSVESQRLVEVFAATHGLHHTDLRALVAVLHAEQRGQPLTPGELREEVGLSSGATTSLIDRLESSGHLRRVRDDPDRRRVRLHYDPSGLMLAQDFFGPLGERSARVMDCFTTEELETVARFLRAMNDTLARHRQGLRRLED
jgi:DNA-binding MarR family transcriptional regulator